METQSQKNLDFLRAVHRVMEITGMRFFQPWIQPGLFFRLTKYYTESVKARKVVNSVVDEIYAAKKDDYLAKMTISKKHSINNEDDDAHGVAEKNILIDQIYKLALDAKVFTDVDVTSELKTVLLAVSCDLIFICWNWPINEMNRLRVSKRLPQEPWVHSRCWQFIQNFRRNYSKKFEVSCRANMMMWLKRMCAICHIWMHLPKNHSDFYPSCQCWRDSSKKKSPSVRLCICILIYDLSEQFIPSSYCSRWCNNTARNRSDYGHLGNAPQSELLEIRCHQIQSGELFPRKCCAPKCVRIHTVQCWSENLHW